MMIATVQKPYSGFTTCMGESFLNNLKTYLLIYLNVLISYCTDLPVVVIALWYQAWGGTCFGDMWHKQPLQNNGVAEPLGFLIS